jgi:hypothetical protein
MLRSKLGLLSLCALALGLMAFASSASAAEWLILTENEKHELFVKTATELNASVVGELEGTGKLLTKLVSIPITIGCTGATLTETKLIGGGKLSTGGSVTFSSCTVETPSTCQVKSKGAAIGTIASTKGKGVLESNGETKIEPETAGGPFAELIFSGASCTLPTEVVEKVSGVLWIKDCEGKVETHLEKHLIVESTAHGHTLFIGSDTAEHLETSLDGSAWVKLSGAHAGLKWGATLP